MPRIDSNPDYAASSATDSGSDTDIDVTGFTLPLVQHDTFDVSYNHCPRLGERSTARHSSSDAEVAASTLRMKYVDPLELRASRTPSTTHTPLSHKIKQFVGKIKERCRKLSSSSTSDGDGGRLRRVRAKTAESSAYQEVWDLVA